MRLTGVGLVAVLFLVLGFVSGSAGSGFFLDKEQWGIVFLIAAVAVGLAADEDPAWNLLFSWAVIGTIAIYFPGLFQRKLTMGLSIPWALLSAFLLDRLLASAEKDRRLLFTSLALILTCASSIRWLFRDIQFIKLNVSNTTRHPVYLNRDLKDILDILNRQSGRTVVLALPGAKNPAVDPDTHMELVDQFESPVLPDIAPILSGLSGAYSYAGHWSETPDYGKCTADMYRFFFKTPFKSVSHVMSPQERTEFIARTGATYAVLPDPRLFSDSPQAVSCIFRDSPLVSPADLGDLVYQGSEFELVRLRP
jgi:arabinosyltransferase C